MKSVIRRNCFETNSSSVHSFGYTKIRDDYSDIKMVIEYHKCDPFSPTNVLIESLVGWIKNGMSFCDFCSENRIYKYTFAIIKDIFNDITKVCKDEFGADITFNITQEDIEFIPTEYEDYLFTIFMNVIEHDHKTLIAYLIDGEYINYEDDCYIPDDNEAMNEFARERL